MATANLPYISKGSSISGSSYPNPNKAVLEKLQALGLKYEGGPPQMEDRKTPFGTVRIRKDHLQDGAIEFNAVHSVLVFVDPMVIERSFNALTERIGLPKEAIAHNPVLLVRDWESLMGTYQSILSFGFTKEDILEHPHWLYTSSDRINHKLSRAAAATREMQKALVKRDPEAFFFQVLTDPDVQDMERKRCSEER
jgi:hypothetical protein